MLYLASFQVLNVSIDVDYVVRGFHLAHIDHFDDIDSFTELLVEQFAGDDHLFEDTGYDHGNPFDTENARFETDQPGATTRLSPQVPHLVIVPSTWPSRVHSASIPCSGYQDITTPPPDRA